MKCNSLFMHFSLFVYSDLEFKHHNSMLFTRCSFGVDIWFILLNYLSLFSHFFLNFISWTALLVKGL
jgi:hypothetical protein